jgi:hypothetical protein
MNQTLQLVLNALGAIASIAVNPAIGLSTQGDKIAKMVSFVIALGNEGEQAHRELISFTAQIKDLDAAGHVPKEVWDGWESRLDAAHARLQG